MNKKTKETIMFTIDSSTKKTGVTIWKNAKYFKTILINYDSNDHKDDKELKKQCEQMNTRYPLMVNAILDLLYQYKPSIIYVEDEVVTRNMDACRFLFRLQGAIEGWAILNNCEFNTVRPTEWRKACDFKQGRGQKRSELKQQSIDYVKKLFNLELTDDEADSVCVGLYVLKKFNLPIKKHERI